MTKSRRIILTTLILIGLALSIELCVVYYNANFAVNAKPSICAINESMDCDGVAKTAYSQFFGVPLSVWGVILYLFFLCMTYVDKLQNLKLISFLKIFKNPLCYMFCIGVFSFTMSMILGCISIFKINSICIFCFMTYFLDLVIAITSKQRNVSFIDNIKTSFEDFTDALKQKWCAITFVIAVAVVVGILTYTSTTNILSPQAAQRNEFLKSFKNYSNITDKNTMGPKDADVVIHEYMDFNCGGCFFAHLYLHRIVNEFKNVKVVQHNLPLEKTCNHNMTNEGHKNSCLKTSYALAASKQGKYWQMADILFEHSPDTEKEIIEKARLLDFDIQKLKADANSEDIKQEIKDLIAEADTREVVGTPTFFIGIKRILGIESYPQFKNIVKEQGGIEKE